MYLTLSACLVKCANNYEVKPGEGLDIDPVMVEQSDGKVLMCVPPDQMAVIMEKLLDK